MRTPEYYEFAGLLAPGSLVLAGILLIYPSLKDILMSEHLSFGGFGIFLIFAFIAGHITQAIGNLLERGWWKLQNGMPTNWILTKDSERILSKDQQVLLKKAIIKKLKIKISDFKGIDGRTWGHITRQIFVYLNQANEPKRIIVFNGNYGLSRGLAVGFAFITIYAAVYGAGVSIVLLMASCMLLSLYRMNLFAIHYAKELFSSFLES